MGCRLGQSSRSAACLSRKALRNYCIRKKLHLDIQLAGWTSKGEVPVPFPLPGKFLPVWYVKVRLVFRGRSCYHHHVWVWCGDLVRRRIHIHDSICHMGIRRTFLSLQPNDGSSYDSWSYAISDTLLTESIWKINYLYFLHLPIQLS